MTVFTSDLPEVSPSFSDDYSLELDSLDLDEVFYELGMELDFED